MQAPAATLRGIRRELGVWLDPRVSSCPRNPKIITGHCSPSMSPSNVGIDQRSLRPSWPFFSKAPPPRAQSGLVSAPHTPVPTRGNHRCHQSNHKAPAWLASTTRPSRRILLAFKIALPVQISTPGSGQRCRDNPRSRCRKPGRPSPSVGRRSGTPRSLAPHGKSCRPRRQRSSKWIAMALPPQ